MTESKTPRTDAVKRLLIERGIDIRPQNLTELWDLAYQIELELAAAQSALAHSHTLLVEKELRIAELGGALAQERERVRRLKELVHRVLDPSPALEQAEHDAEALRAAIEEE